VHIDPAEAVAAHEAVGASTSVAMHFGTFPLGDDGFAEPLRDLREALARRGDAPRFWVLEEGFGKEIPPCDRSEPGPTASSTT
jgi:L-ascorbate metabolism protein UlaG (beta-lactamase superfamily)